jgi:lipoprotein-anchoring transpeptidase ErfK/SrfK
MTVSLAIDAPVGRLQPARRGNEPDDVVRIRAALDRLNFDVELGAGSSCSPVLISTIGTFQGLFMTNPDRRIDPRGTTIRKLRQLSTGKTIVVSLRRQVLVALNDLQPAHTFDCVSGDSAHPTPPGLYRVHRKHRRYRSRTYDAQMDYAMFFHRGYAIHMAYGVTFSSYLRWAGATELGSHGCVRLAESDARLLFAWTAMQTRVLIWPA